MGVSRRAKLLQNRAGNFMRQRFHREVNPMASWKCANCGYTFEADAPPDQCPSCKEKCEFLDNSCYTPDCTAEGMDPRIAPKK
jgi:rubrerythrin